MSVYLHRGFFLSVILISFADAGITPADETYKAVTGEDVTFPWVFTDETDMFSVDWKYKESSASSATIIMSQAQASSAVASSNYAERVTHNGNGRITLNKVSESDRGIYICEVAYTLGSGHAAVTGTATLEVSSARTPDCGCPSLNRCDFSKGQCGGCWFGIAIAILAGIAGIVFMILKFVVGVNFPCGNRHQS